METVARNAGQSLDRHKLQRAGDLTVRSQALEELQQALDLAEAPLRIECYDVSHHQGAETVASMVVFEDGLARKGEYRRFAIKGVDGNDDTAAMHEVITRRFKRYLEERADLAEPELGDDSDDREDRERRADPAGDGPSGFGGLDPDTGRPRKFAYPPQLVVVDGGPPQVARRGRARWPSSASTTSRSPGWPSGWRRSGCPARTTRSCCPAPAKGSTCCSGCATRRTGSPSPSTASGGPRP